VRNRREMAGMCRKARLLLHVENRPAATWGVSVNTRLIRENLGKAKLSTSRQELRRALFLTIAAIKELGGKPFPFDMRGEFREVLSNLLADPEFRKVCTRPIAYQPGKEGEILAIMANAWKILNGAVEAEDYEATLSRKLKLDRSIIEGRRLLSEGKPSEADAAFAEAMKYYKDETAVFLLFAKVFMEAKEYVRALGHLRQGLKVDPDNETMRSMAEECLNLRNPSAAPAAEGGQEGPVPERQVPTDAPDPDSQPPV
jgi:tetratricopeptide (TPR) repeat protein